MVANTTCLCYSLKAQAHRSVAPTVSIHGRASHRHHVGDRWQLHTIGGPRTGGVSLSEPAQNMPTHGTRVVSS